MQHDPGAGEQLRRFVGWGASPKPSPPYKGTLLKELQVCTDTEDVEVREAARIAPRNAIVIETDSPYLAPNPKRGARCKPAFVAYTLAALAGIRGEDLAVLAAATTMSFAQSMPNY